MIPTCCGPVRTRFYAVAVAAVLLVTILAWMVPCTWPQMQAVVSRSLWGPVYTVADVSQGLARDPVGWLGRTVHVRGRAVHLRWLTRKALGAPRSAPSLNPPLLLTQSHPDDPASVAALPLSAGPADPLLTSLRALPLVGRLMPPPQVPHIRAVAVYWVRLQVTLRSACSTCYEAVLLDAAQT